MPQAKEVLDLGIADAMFKPQNFIEQSLYWAVGVLRGDHQVERPGVDRGQAWDDAVAKGRVRCGQGRLRRHLLPCAPSI